MTHDSDIPEHEHDDAWHDRVEHNEMHEMAADRAEAAEAISGTSQPATAATEEIDADRLGSVLYAWMMLDPERGWNIISMSVPGSGPLPMVSTDMNVAWHLLDVAQAHANRYGVRCELAVYERSTTIAIVDPEVPT